MTVHSLTRKTPQNLVGFLDELAKYLDVKVLFSGDITVDSFYEARKAAGFPKVEHTAPLSIHLILNAVDNENKTERWRDYARAMAFLSKNETEERKKEYDLFIRKAKAGLITIDNIKNLEYEFPILFTDTDEITDRNKERAELVLKEIVKDNKLEELYNSVLKKSDVSKLPIGTKVYLNPIYNKTYKFNFIEKIDDNDWVSDNGRGASDAFLEGRLGNDDNDPDLALIYLKDPQEFKNYNFQPNENDINNLINYIIKNHPEYFISASYHKYMFKKTAAAKKKRVDLDTRPFPNPLFQNYDYTASGPNEISPGGSPYFGKPGGGEKSMGDWIKKRRKQLKKRERKLRADYFSQLTKKANVSLINEYNQLVDALGVQSNNPVPAAAPLPSSVQKTYSPQNTYGNYKRMSVADKDLQQISYDILKKHIGKPYGFSVPFEHDGKKYLAVIEEHDGGSVPGKHPGVSLFTEKVYTDKSKGLNPKLQGLARQLIEQAKKEGIQLIIASGYRSNEEQEKLYQQGRTTKGPVVTHAKPGQSKHNSGMAFDVAPLDKNGKPHWPNDDALWEKIGRIGESLGLKWGGRWAGFRDRPHFELAAMQSGRGLAFAKLAGYDPESWYYKWETGVTLQTIIDRWQNMKQKMYDSSMPLLISIDELWPYREYVRTRDKGNRSPEEWDELKQNMSENGWNAKDPLIMNIGSDGGVKIGEGNHRIAIAKELGIKEVPVRFIFLVGQVSKTIPITRPNQKRPQQKFVQTQQTSDEDVDEIMNLLFNK